MAIVGLLLAGCVVRPAGEAAERERALEAGRIWSTEPALPERDAPLATWQAWAERHNGELEAAWHEWLVALEQVPQASTQDTTAMLGVEHRTGGGSAFDRTGLALMSDAMNNVLMPGRLAARGEAVLARARVAAAELDRARLRLRTRVAEAFLTLGLRDEEIRLAERLRSVLAVQVPSVRARLATGAAEQGELLAAEVALLRVDAELRRLREGRPALAETLFALCGGRRGASDPSPALPPLAPLDGDDQRTVEEALARNPDLEVRRREHDAMLAEVAEREWMRVPEFAGRGVLMGDGILSLAGAVTLPFLRGTAIEAGIRQAEASARAAAAMRRQAGADAVAMALAELAGLRAIADEARILADALLPKLRQMADVARASWAAGRGEFTAWVSAVAGEVEVERMVARLRMESAVGRARLAELIGGQWVGE
jgi:outer membrane protein TolC